MEQAVSRHTIPRPSSDTVADDSIAAALADAEALHRRIIRLRSRYAGYPSEAVRLGDAATLALLLTDTIGRVLTGGRVHA